MSEKQELLIKKAYEEVEKHKNEVENDPYRLAYHLMPPVGLLNDPNGLVQFNGVYHVFYQWNPFETAHGAKFWGHYSSKDMINWREEPVALVPSEWYEKNGCYSGSAIEWEGKLYLFYTGNVKLEDGTRETYQCLAISTDGIHFEKFGPVLNLPEGYTAHFRDPKVWRADGRFYMILGAQTLEEKGAAALFVSDDLYNWLPAGRVAGAGMNGLGEFGYMWECPDLIHLDGKDVLLVSPQGLEPSGYLYNNIFQSGYFTGRLDGTSAQFEHGPFTELDRGFDFYAPQTFLADGGRTILYAWMGITDEAEAYQPTVEKGWVHALTIPRVLSLKGDKLFQAPVEEMKMLRKDEMIIQNAKTAEITGLNGKAAELLLDTILVGAGDFTIRFRNEAELCYDADKREMSLQRRNFRTGNPETRTCKLAELNSLHIFMDHSSLEIFINGGEEVFTARYFPNPGDELISFHGDAEFNFAKWTLDKMQIGRILNRGGL
ncbi:glycoside hydrolase family 32 protein [Bacillus sp. B-jedd]|uniref:glycoside hydrolase family 32 protein n=1 Tax=Bacillus sp. B-jedd TaxID=1476857 RepID=UPI0005157297|nr:sucrose-6-phosphate hydrolase [Bacillus sp. B-jedd]CEG29351.1 sucrase-6-phosphate hydrolase [Bacillus sp. B-jedd]